MSYLEDRGESSRSSQHILRRLQVTPDPENIFPGPLKTQGHESSSYLPRRHALPGSHNVDAAEPPAPRIPLTNLKSPRLPSLHSLHSGWVASNVSTAKCDICHRPRCGTIQKCVECKLSICRECGLSDRLRGDDRHLLDPNAVSWDMAPIPHGRRRRSARQLKARRGGVNRSSGRVLRRLSARNAATPSTHGSHATNSPRMDTTQADSHTVTQDDNWKEEEGHEMVGEHATAFSRRETRPNSATNIMSSHATDTADTDDDAANTLLGLASGTRLSANRHAPWASHPEQDSGAPRLSRMLSPAEPRISVFPPMQIGNTRPRSHASDPFPDQYAADFERRGSSPLRHFEAVNMTQPHEPTSPPCSFAGPPHHHSNSGRIPGFYRDADEPSQIQHSQQRRQYRYNDAQTHEEARQSTPRQARDTAESREFPAADRFDSPAYQTRRPATVVGQPDAIHSDRRPYSRLDSHAHGTPRLSRNSPDAEPSPSNTVLTLGTELKDAALAAHYKHHDWRLDECLRLEVLRTWSSEAFCHRAAAGSDQAKAFRLLLAATYFATLHLQLPVPNAARNWLCEQERRLCEEGMAPIRAVALPGFLREQ